ncbi:sigma-70 family RNA polymerase sigma factor [Streptomyces sp. NPDC051976]|uniref:sigma-70 family RNA polymerase sigma factor n=1 Tax=Streptomyces sp. NPDC051976 TaxID=3154947 RepID=UPI00341A7783
MSARHDELTSMSDEELTAALRRSAQDPTTQDERAAHPGMAEEGARALAELYRRHGAAVLATARSFTGFHSAEDLASEAFLRTVRAVRQGAGPTASWRPYLYAVVRHAAAEYARVERAQVPLADFQAWCESLPEAADPEGAVLHSEQTRLLVRSFRSLPDRWQDVLWQRLLNDRPTTEVARSLGLTPNGVTSLLARAQEGLRGAYLQAHVQHGGDAECQYYAGQLGSAVRSESKRSPALARHLDRCDRCSTAFADLEHLNTRLQTLAPFALVFPAVAHSVTLGVTSVSGATVNAVSGKSAGVAAKGLGAKGMGGVAAGAVAVAGAVVVGLTLWSGPTAPSGPGSKAASTSAAAPPAATIPPSSAAAPPPPKSPAPRLVTGTRIRSAAWGTCVGADGDQVVALSCDDPRTAWRRIGGDHFRLAGKVSGQCLTTADHYDRTSFNGGGIWSVRLSSCTTADTWSVPGFSDQVTRLVNDTTHGALSIGKTFSRRPPTTFIVYGAYTGSADQRFTLK